MEIVGGRVLGADGATSERTLAIADGRIAGCGGGDGRWDAGGLLVLQGLVDINGDAFERQLMPRPGVQFPYRLALLETDRQLVANGITTAYHGLTWSWEPGLRSAEAAHDFRAALTRERARLAADTRLHLRFEIVCLDAVDEVERWIGECAVDLLAFNDHIDHILAIAKNPDKLAVYTARTGMGPEAFLRQLDRLNARRPEVPAAVARLAAAARTAGVPMISHDDETPAMRAAYDDLGCRISEFPVDPATAEAARARGNPIVLGSPNVLRGGSHCGRMGAADAVAAGLCTILTSDYYYPAMLQAAFRLASARTVSLAQAWRLVSANPAAAVGLDDRGEIAPGKRADLVIVDDSDPAAPQVVATFVAGRLVYAACDALRRVA